MAGNSERHRWLAVGVYKESFPSASPKDADAALNWSMWSRRYRNTHVGGL